MKKLFGIMLIFMFIFSPVNIRANEENNVNVENKQIKENQREKEKADNNEKKDEYILVETSQGLKCKRNGKFVVDEFVTVKDKDYYFDNGGISRYGWILHKDDWYFIKNQKLIESGIHEIYGEIYFFNNKKAVKNEFVEINGRYKYFNDNCQMVKKAWYLIDKKWYYLDNNGNRLEEGIHKINGEIYGFKDGYAVEYGWLQISEGNWHYFGKNCYLERGKFIKNSDGTKSYVDKNGKRVEYGWRKFGDDWYFFKEGKMITKEVVKHTDGINYYLDKNGKMVYKNWVKNDYGNWMYFETSGKRIENGWFKVREDWFYFKDGFAIADAWAKDSYGKDYYLDSSCYMAYNKWIQNNDGKWLYLSKSGAKVESGWYHDGEFWSYFENGIAVSNKFIDYKGSRYYISKYCYMKEDEWAKMDNGDWMYFDKGGKLVTDDFIGRYYVGFDGVWFDASNKRILNVPVLSQLTPYYLPMGCEGTSFTMAIRYKGVLEYTQKDINSMFKITGDPRTGFIGSPFSPRLVQGTTPTIWPKALIGYTSGVYNNVEDLTGCDLSTMLREIDKGNPVVYWFCYPLGRMVNVSTPNGTVKNSTSMHCVTLVGYDETGLYYNDPITNRTERLSMAFFYNNFVRYGRMAITVR